MRALIALLFLAAPAHAWEFSARPICRLMHAERGATVEVTYDHATRLYAIALARPGGWPPAATFSIRFEGGVGRTISTPRHAVAGDTLTVTDTGFGNVLDGLEFNTTATAFTQDAQVRISLHGAAGPVRAFRACAASPVA